MKQVVVIAGPSGSGKNAILRGIMDQFHNCERLVTTTTRLPRPGEVDGIDYHFFSLDRFDEEFAAGNIVERRFVPVLNTYYGIWKPDLERRLATGKIVFCIVDIEGARYLKQTYDATTIFIMPESLGQFRSRLRVRNPEWSEKEFEARMKISEEEIRVHAPQYDYRVINADGGLTETIAEVIDILMKEGYTLE
ncbi:MAG TPA: hypothetical protein VMU25_04035 [Candidatus Paceibacterota bacterium]|nr:hypothetical protein [Candidatus Paceibacterota bacterium]